MTTDGEYPGMGCGRAAAWICGLAFLLGATVLLGQVIALRTFLAVIEENELFIGIFYGAWFMGIFLGAWVGSRLKTRGNAAARVTLGALVAQAALLPVVIASIETVRTTLGVSAAENFGLARLMLVTLAHLVPFSFVTGLVFPLLNRLAGQAAVLSESSLGWIYGWESLGSLAGGALFTFVLAGRAGALAVTLAMAVATALVAASAIGFLSRDGASKWRTGLWLVAALYAVAWLPAVRRPLEDGLTRRWWKAYGEGLEHVADRETPYQRLTLARQGEQYSLLSNGKFVYSFPDPYGAAELANLILAERPSPRRILLIGGAGRGLVKYWLSAGPQRIDVVEVDPATPEFLMPYLPEEDRRALEDPRVSVQHADGRWFVKRLTAGGAPPPAARYDLIVCLAPDPTTAAINRFYTREFFRQARHALAERGILVLQLTSAVNYFGEEVSGLVGSVYKALSEEFAGVVATPGTQTIFFASPDRATPVSDADTLIGRWRSMALSARGFSPLYFHTVFEAGALRFLDASLKRIAPGATTNSDLHPVSYFYALRLWERFSGSRARWLTWLVDRARPVPLAVLLVLFGGAWWAWARAARGRGGGVAGGRATIIIATTGGVTMALSILLLLAFQISFGFLYREIGLLAGLFMAGLAAGSFVFRRPRKRPARALAQAEAALAGYAAGLAGVFWFLLARNGPTTPAAVFATYAVLILAAGFLGGAEFAIAGHLLRSAGGEIGRTAGRIDAADHLGACAGALAASVVLVPALGLVGTLIFLAALKLLGVWICVVPRATSKSH